MDSLTMYEPLQYFESISKEKHHQNVLTYFDMLLKKSGVDAAENKRTVEAYRQQLETTQNIEKKMNNLKLAKGGLIALIVLSAIIILSALLGSMNVGLKILLFILSIAAISGSIYLMIKKVNPVIKNSAELLAIETKKAEELLQKATEQMAPLNALFDDRDTFRIIEETLPELRFDSNYSAERNLEFVTKYDYTAEEDDEMSVIDTLSGTLYHNPFVFERYMIHQMGEETYSGSLTIYWVEEYTDSDGNVIREQHSEVLTATVEKPKPNYSQKTILRFGHQGAPELSFSRTNHHIERLSDKTLERRVKSGEKEMQKKAREAIAEGRQFTEMANSKFDVLFGAVDRDNEVQFRMMFTPLAQTEMMKLMRSQSTYGDDFDFLKEKRCNYICSEHAQSWDMDTTPEKFYSYDLEEAKEKFIAFNEEYYKSIYFDFAPLLAIPLYQQKPTKALAKMENELPNYTLQEYEVMGNAIDQALVAHSKTETEAIVKATFVEKQKDVDIVGLKAYSYRTVERVDYVPVYGGDGNYHNVPVPWIEYIPLTKTTTMAVRASDCSICDFTKKASSKYREPLGDIAERCAFTHGLFAYLFEPKEKYSSAVSKISFLDKQ